MFFNLPSSDTVKVSDIFYTLTRLGALPRLYKNQLTDLQSKSVVWRLYDKSIVQVQDKNDLRRSFCESNQKQMFL